MKTPLMTTCLWMYLVTAWVDFLPRGLAQDAAAPSEIALDQLRQARKEAAHRPRRVIFNNDGCDVLYFPRDTPATPENLLALRTAELAGTQVDAIAYCTISSGFSFFTHDTRAGQVLTRSPADFGLRPDSQNVAQKLIDQGAECLRLMVDFAHKHQKEIFWSMRMNDTHDAAYRPDKPYLLYPPLKVEHPDWLVGEPIHRTPVGRWSSVDYARPEIRDLAFRYIHEVCENYDVDGVELDYFRHLCYFRSTAAGGVASQAQRDMMTDLVRRIRTMTEELGLRRGRPILVSIRVPDSVEFCRDLGLDLERWLEEGLVDMLVTTCYFRLNPWEYSVDLGHKYRVNVYPCLSDSRVKGETRFRRTSVESYRGRAANAWAAGADGIHIFNHFNPHSPVFREVGDPQALGTMNKLYFVTVRDGNPESFLAGGRRHQNVPVFGPGRPGTVTARKPLKLNIVLSEDLSAAKQAGYNAKMVCHLEMPGVQRPEQVIVKFNGQELAGGKLVDGWLDVPLPSECVRHGNNEVELSMAPSDPATDDWNVVYEGRRLPARPWKRDSGSPRTGEKIVDGSLLITDRGTESGDYLYWRFPWGAAPQEPTVIEARAKVVSGSSYILISNGVAHERLGLWPDRIDLWNNRSLRYAMDTTADFHVYRVTMEGEDLKVYVDGQLRLDASGRFKPAGGIGRNEVAFGAANSPQVGEAYWSYFKARSSGQPCNDLVVSVEYERP